MNIYQGDQNVIGVKLKDDTEAVITPEDVSEVIITLGNLSRRTTDDEDPVTYDSEREAWLFSVKQEDTLAMTMGIHRLSARVEFDDGTIGNANVAVVFILPSGNTEVME